MAYDLPAKLLASNLAFRTFAYSCSAEGIHRSVTGFSSFVKFYVVESCLKTKACTQFMVEIAVGLKSFDELISALRKIFDCLRESGLKVSSHKWDCGTTKTFIR